MGTLKTLAVFVVIISSVFILTVGCATQGVKYSGFLEDYPAFEQGAKGGVDWAYVKEGVNFRKYHKILMDPVVFYFKKDAQDQGIRADVLQKMSSVFRQSVEEAVKGSYEMVDAPAKNVLRIRFAITEVVPSKESLVSFRAGAQAAGMRSYVNIGSASMEAEVLDSLTNERLAVAIDTQVGKELQSPGEVNTWQDTRDAFEFWAKRLRIWLDETHGK